MFKISSKLFRVIVVFILLGVVFGIGVNVRNIADPNAEKLVQLCGIVSIIALMAALYYIILGYGKNAAVYFKFYLWLFDFSALLSIIGAGIKMGNTLDLIAASVIFALVLVMAIGKDLGKRNSTIICSVVFALAVLRFAAVAAFDSSLLADSQNGLTYIFRLITTVVMASVMWIMTYAKYADKDSRKTK